MRTLIERVEAEAAARLAAPPDATDAQTLAHYRDTLRELEQELHALHRDGTAGGREYCQARAALIDALMRRLWEAAKTRLSAQAQKEFPPLALVALGGYGRAELNPYSDFDIMFLHDGQVVAGRKPLPHLRKLTDGVLYPLWDLDFKLGHSARTISDCVEEANSDMKTKTSLIEARWLAGDARLFEKLQKAVLAKCVEGHEEEYIAARLQDQAGRREKFGNSATMQEPNIKNGCGGLRDFQNLHWMAFFKYRTRTLEDMEQRGLMSADERKELAAAYDFLLRVRTELHLQAGRLPGNQADVLYKNLQPRVAGQLGFTDRSPSLRLERFMRVLYTHSRHIHLITRTLEERLALLPQPRRLPSLRQFMRRPLRPPPEQLADGFKFREGKIHAALPTVFKDQPARMMRAFLHAQQRGLALHPDLTQQMRQELALVDREFLHDAHARETFLEILNRRGSVGRTLRTMHDVGLLGRYLPEFGRLTCLVQHEFYHQYTADEHTLQCLEQLDTIWESERGRFKHYAPLLQGLERPFVLCLALLLHDAGKAEHSARHAAASAQLAARAARRLDLDAATTHDLCLLVGEHLTMARVSQRRDLDDPAVIRSFAGVVQHPENLRMLTLLTFVDAQATSDKLWNDFKDSLLWQLYNRTLRALVAGPDLGRAEEKQREQLAGEVKRRLPRHIAADEWEAHFQHLPPRYFHIHTAEEVVRDLELAHDFMLRLVAGGAGALHPVLTWRDEPDRGYTSVRLCTWDRPGLFSKLAGSFSAAGINILDAQVFSRSDGIVLDTFSVTDARGGGLLTPEGRAACEGLLQGALSGEEMDFPALIARQTTAHPLYQSLEGERLPTRVHFDPHASDTRTVVDLETEDRLGLLYAVSKVFSELGLDISLAKICTEKGAAVDTFYISEVGGQKVRGAERQKLIEARLLQALEALDAAHR